MKLLLGVLGGLGVIWVITQMTKKDEPVTPLVDALMKVNPTLTKAQAQQVAKAGQSVFQQQAQIKMVHPLLNFRMPS